MPFTPREVIAKLKRAGLADDQFRDVSLAENYGFSRRELRGIEQMARENLEILRNEWDAFCHGGTHAREDH